MAVVSKDIVIKALGELSEDQMVEVLDFIGYLQWRSRERRRRRSTASVIISPKIAGGKA